ncbi:MAG: AraC-like DNA-binding protein [Myxococcota bacterium]
MKERDMAVPKPQPPRGLLRKIAGPITHQRWSPDPGLSTWVEHFWSVSWQLPEGETFEAATLPHPCIHWICEGGRSVIAGPQRRRFVRVLRGSGRVFAVKFRPGGFRDWLGGPAHPLTDTETELSVLLPELAADWAKLEPSVEAAEPFLLAHRPSLNPDLSALHDLMVAIETDRSITTVAQLCQRTGLSKRAMQRWFRDMVGVSPKRVIRRYRLLGALDILDTAAPGRLAELALSLGYADQAHFSRDFKATIGVSPGAWIRQREDKLS